MRIAILYICTGAYTYFWDAFYRSFEEKFIPEAEKDYYVFTDGGALSGEADNPRIHRFYQENLGWPGNTLFRFRVFHRVIDELRGYDYVFYLNANLICKETITAAEFLPKKHPLVFVWNPGGFGKRPYRFAYERDPRSLAQIPYRELRGRHYVCGGVNGGKADAYCDMITELEKRIDDDYARGVIARWHDESHINRYAVDHPDYRLLSPAYCYPEGWSLPFEKKILVLEKDRYIPMPDTKRPKYKKNEGSLPVRAARSVRARTKTAVRTATDAARDTYLALYFRLHGK